MSVTTPITRSPHKTDRPHIFLKGLRLPQPATTLWPGMVLACMVAAATFSVRQVPGLGAFSPMILAVVFGIAFARVVGTPALATPGLFFCQRSLLRLGIVLLGFQLTASQVLSIGWIGIGLVALTLVATFAFTAALGRLIGVERKLTQLIAAGTSICGASAIIATNAVTRARQEDVAYAVAAITLFGTVAMVTFPLAAPLLGLDHHHFGLWAGASIHEVAQVIGASFQNGHEAGEIGTVAKLSRIAMLAPMVIGLDLLARRAVVSSEVATRPPLPWFVFAFVAVVTCNSLVQCPAGVKSVMASGTTILLTAGLAAMGLQTNLAQIRARGFRPLILALSAFLFIAGFSLLLVKLVG